MDFLRQRVLLNPLLVLILSAFLLGAAAAFALNAASLVFLGLLLILLIVVVLIEQPFWVIVGIAAYLPFEDFLLKWVPVPDNIFLILRLGSELIVYVLLARVLLGRILFGKKPIFTLIDALLLAFIFSAFLSLFVNDGSLLAGFINIRALLRYFAVYYIVVNLNVSEEKVLCLLSVIALAGLLEAGIALAQFFGGPSVDAFFSPPTDVDIEIASMTVSTFSNVLKIGAVAGTIGKPAAMGLFLVVTMITMLSLWSYGRVSNIMLGFGTLLIAAGVIVTLKRGELILLTGAIVVFLILKLRPRSRYYLSTLATVVLLLMILLIVFMLGQGGEVVNPKAQKLSIVEHFNQLFSSVYWNRQFRSSRGWFLTEVGGYALQHSGFLGYSPDDSTARATLADAKIDFKRLIEFPVFEDVYWVAMLIYYGILGLILFQGIIISLIVVGFRTLSQSGIASVIAIAFLTIALVTYPAAFLERVFELRTYSFYLWLFAGLTVSLHQRDGQKGLSYELATPD